MDAGLLDEPRARVLSDWTTGLNSVAARAVCAELLPRALRLPTLLGHDQYPAELAGWGPVHAELARELATALGGAQWRFAITDELGHLHHCGITQVRPTGIPTRTAACRAVVELAVPRPRHC
jgi:hypothetical protein